MKTFALCVLLLIGCSPNNFGPKLQQTTNSIGMKLVLVPAGRFTMGSPIEEIGADDNELPHEVTISKAFYLGVYEVTQGQYEKVMNTNPSHFQKRVILKSDSSMYPVETVSWYDAVAFCKKLSELPEEKVAGRVYRLPTEAEWEYACRAGSSTRFPFGHSPTSLGKYACFKKNSNSQTHPVGEKLPNAWGLHDMQGNVLEWCQDWFGEYPAGAITDPKGPSERKSRVRRGGCYFENAETLRLAYRDRHVPVDDVNYCGFRIALSPIDTSPEKK